MNIKLLFFFNARRVILHFFYVIIKICVVSVVEIKLRAIPVKYGPYAPTTKWKEHIHLNIQLHISSTIQTVINHEAPINQMKQLQSIRNRSVQHNASVDNIQNTHKNRRCPKCGGNLKPYEKCIAHGTE